MSLSNQEDNQEPFDSVTKRCEPHDAEGRCLTRADVYTLLQNQLESAEDFNVYRFSKQTGVGKTTLRRWKQEILQNVQLRLPPQRSATFLPSAPAAGSLLLGQARQPPQYLQVPQVSALLMQHGLNVFDQGVLPLAPGLRLPQTAVMPIFWQLLMRARARVWQQPAWYTTLASSVASWYMGGRLGAPPPPQPCMMAYAAACAPQVAPSDSAAPLLQCSALI